MGEGTKIDDSVSLYKSVLGYGVTVAKNAKIKDSVIFSGCKIDDNVIISHSIIGPNCLIKSKSQIIAGSVVGEGTVIDKGLVIENSLVQSDKPSECK